MRNGKNKSLVRIVLFDDNLVTGNVRNKICNLVNSESAFGKVAVPCLIRNLKSCTVRVRQPVFGYVDTDSDLGRSLRRKFNRNFDLDRINILSRTARRCESDRYTRCTVSQCLLRSISLLEVVGVAVSHRLDEVVDIILAFRIVLMRTIAPQAKHTADRSNGGVVLDLSYRNSLKRFFCTCIVPLGARPYLIEIIAKNIVP